MNTYQDIEGCTERFYEIVLNAIKLYVPEKVKKIFTFPCWFSCELRKLISEKKQIHKKYKQTGSLDDYLLFASMREKCKVETDRCYRKYVESVELEVSSNPEYFWKFINDKKTQKGFPKSMYLRDETANDDAGITELFRKYFSEIYRKSKPDESRVIYYEDTVDIHDCHFSETEVLNVLGNLPDKSDTGPDRISALFLKKCRHVLLGPLVFLFNLSVSSGKYPNKWKSSFVTPVFKSGNISDVGNYRPVTKSSYIPKILDTLITNKITPLLKNIFIEEQHGFIAGRSVTTNLLYFTDLILSAFSERSQVDAVYTDFAKAFDRLPHWLLIIKLKALGFRPPLLEWISDRLIGLTQFIKISDTLSGGIEVSSGVPQGSPLSPILFLCFINDIKSVIRFCHFLLFADDMKLFRLIRSLNDCLLLQRDIEDVIKWCVHNQLEINVNKCHIMRFFRTNSTILFDYSVDSCLLKSVNTVRDLGVLLDAGLSFTEHINHITSRAFRMLGFIKRHMQDFSVSSIKTIYIAYVRSILEYSCIVWSPHYAIHIQAVERVQNKFLKWIGYKWGLTSDAIRYDEIREKLCLISLEARRHNFDIMLIYKILHNFIDSPFLLQRINLNVPQRNFRTWEQFNIKFSRTNYGMNNPLDRALRAADSVEVDLFNVSLFQLKNYFRSLNNFH